MKRFALALMLLATPATAETVIMKTPATPLEVCEIDRAHLVTRHDELENVNDHLAATIMLLNGEIAAIKERKPVAAKPKKKVQVCVRRNATRCTWLKWVWK